MKIYLDHCTYNRPFDNQDIAKNRLETAAKMHIQSQIKDGVYDLVWSFMNDYENSRVPNSAARKYIQKWKRAAKFKCSASESIRKKSTEIQKRGVGFKDSLHIACAIECSCDYFITTDTGITKKKFDEILTINPIDFVNKVEVSK